MARFTELELTTLVTGMHLIPELGNSIEHIRQDGFPISEQVPLATMDNGLGLGHVHLVMVYPDLLTHWKD